VLRLGRSVLLDDPAQGLVDARYAQVVAVLDIAELSESVHEKIDPGSGCADHLREHLLRYGGESSLRITRRAAVREPEQNMRQAFLAGIQKLANLRTSFLFDKNKFFINFLLQSLLECKSHEAA